MTAYHVLCIVLVAWNWVYILRGLGGETMINSGKNNKSIVCYLSWWRKPRGREKVEQDRGSWEYGVGCNFEYKPHIEGDFWAQQSWSEPGRSHVGIKRKCIPGRGIECQGFRAGVCVFCSGVTRRPIKLKTENVKGK